MLVALGDKVGHPFRGNQWTSIPASVKNVLQRGGVRIVTTDRPDVAARGGAAYLKYQGVIAVTKGTSKDTLTHEVGHAVDHVLGGSGTVRDRAFDTNDYWSKSLTETLAADLKSATPKVNGPSWNSKAASWDYAFGSTQEAFAAIFADLNGSGKKINNFSVREAMPKTYSVVRRKLHREGLLLESRSLGDRVGHPFRGNQWTDAALAEEQKHQETLAAAQTNPIANMPIVLGMENDRNGNMRRFISAYGEEFTPAPLPAGIERGQLGECFRNASLLVMEHPELDYVEGIGSPANLPAIGYIHAWGVTKEGKVVDPTWDKPEGGKYFGVKFNRRAYLASLYKQKIYGVIGGDIKHATRAMATGARGLR